jgi:hypothetical protein
VTADFADEVGDTIRRDPFSGSERDWRSRITPSDPAPPNPPSNRKGERIAGDADLATQILVAGAAMVGVSLTLVGLTRIIQNLGKVSTIADNLLAGAAIVFLFACLSAYLALRATTVDRARFWLRFADATFVVGLLAMVGLGVLLAIELI